MKIPTICLFAISSICLVLMQCVTGCVNIPPEAKMLAENVQTNVAALHDVHARDVRALAIVVNQREATLKEANWAVRDACQKMLEAQISASKTKVLAEFDQQAGEVLGAQFQVKLEKDIYPTFDELERTNFDLLVQLEGENPNDPFMPEKKRSAERTLYGIRGERQNVVSFYFLELKSAIDRQRFIFEGQIEQEYGNLTTNLIAFTSDANATNQSLANFNKRVDDKIALLDKSYNQLDQSLSELSSDLDGAALSHQYINSFFTGVGSALVDDLDTGQLAAASISQLLHKDAPGFVNQLNSIESSMLTQAANSVTNAINSVPTPPPLTSTSSQ